MYRHGVMVTVEISVGAYLVGLVIGGFAAWAKLRGPHWPAAIANGYSTICRAVPEILLIIILFYAGQTALNACSPCSASAIVGISGFAAAIIVLGLVQGAYASEILRGAVLAIPRARSRPPGPMASGASRVPPHDHAGDRAFALPGLANLWMIIVKDSTLISVVGYNELMFTAKQAAGATKYYFASTCSSAVIYYIITLISNIVHQA